jgi:glycosyltransferase involved in cell wall biosynthesis
MIVGMLRIKNEARWIRASLSSISPLCDRIVVLDDHSDDGTMELCRSFGEPVTVLASPFQGLDEHRDKNYLLTEVMKFNPQWCLCIDGDEILEPSAPERIKTELKHSSHSCYSLQVIFLWNAPDTIRIDGVYGRFWRPSLFRALPDAAFRPTRFGGHFHCGNVPAGLTGSAGTMTGRLFHVGYMCRADRLRKYEWYNRIDPDDEDEDCYRHMVQGDIPEVPAHLRLKHAGPLTLAPLR